MVESAEQFQGFVTVRKGVRDKEVDSEHEKKNKVVLVGRERFASKVQVEMNRETMEDGSYFK